MSCSVCENALSSYPDRHGPCAADPHTIWIVTCGNATCALDLVDYFESKPQFRDDLFVLADYPGYGISEGRPTPDSIRESMRALLPALARQQGQSVGSLKPKLRVWGHSLGCAAALMLMEDSSLERGVLVAPFRSMLEMARLRVGWPLCHLLHHRFDNEAALQHLSERGRCQLEIIHGTDDEVIPQSQSKALASTFPAMVHFESATNGTHNGILTTHQLFITTAMARLR